MEFYLSTVRQDETELNTTFFSRQNMARIQKTLQERVYAQTRRLIDLQSYDDLFTIMRGIFVTTRTDSDTNIASQIIYLNGKVLDVIVPQVLYGIEAHSVFLKDIETPVVPMEHGEYNTRKGEDSNELPVGM